MWKVMLADDEPYVREGMEKLIPWKELECQLVFQAKNGRELVEQMEREKPDIVIVDIRMPVMGGLEVAKYIEENNLGIKVIVLTAYTDFQYARQAIQYQVVDYIIKTSVLDEIPKSLQKITSQLQESRLMTFRMLTIYGIEDRGGMLEKIVSSCLEQEKRSCFSSGEKCFCVVLAANLISDHELERQCCKLVEMADSFLGRKVTVGISPVYRDARNVNEIYDQTFEYLMNHMSTTSQPVLWVREVEVPGELSGEERLLPEKGAVPGKEGLLPEKGAVPGKEGLLPEKRNVSGKDGLQSGEGAASGEEEDRSREAQDLVKKAQELIEKQFCSRLTLYEIADQVHANPSYLSRLYKQKTGENLFDAINRMRIEQAGRYIKSQKYKFYEIAELVGFEDTAYFSRVFRKYTGMSPREYDAEDRKGAAVDGKEENPKG